MLTLRPAAALLAAASDCQSLARVAAALGCDGTPDPLDAPTRVLLGIPTDFVEVRIATGRGALRALLLEAQGTRAIRESITRLASRLAARTPHLLWIAIASHRETRELAIAAWSAGRHPPRVVALVVDGHGVLESDAETLCALSAAMGDVDVLVHARWIDVLGRDALTRRFYRALEGVVGTLADAAGGNALRARNEERRELALLYISRLLFLSFLEAKGWLDGNRAFLSHGYDDCLASGGRYHQRVLLPLFFGTLNTPFPRRASRARALGRIPFLNGGLFSRTPLERGMAVMEFSDEALGRVFGDLLDRYRFTAREESGSWSEAAIDPEMLGKAFESLMASGERRASGAFYTPQPLVDQVAGAALRESLSAGGLGHAVADALIRGARVPAELEKPLRQRVGALTVLDPSCGSGAFLVHALERLASMRVALGDARPLSEIRRDVVSASVFGVDVNPTAVWLCELRLWLSMVIDSDVADPAHVPPLPNLDHHVRVGDALAGGAWAPGSRTGGARVALLRSRYARAVGGRKRRLADALEREERAQALRVIDHRLRGLATARRDLLCAVRGRDLFGQRRTVARAELDALAELRSRVRDWRARRRRIAAGGALPFSFASHFPDVAARGGFDLVIGNPPWVRVHRIAPGAREALRQEFSVYRNAAWEAGAASANAGAGFGGQVDLAAMFVERSLSLARSGGVVALLVPAKLWRSLAGGGVRRLVAERNELTGIFDRSASSSGFDAAVYPSIVVVRRRASTPERTPEAHGGGMTQVAVHLRNHVASWTAERDSLPFDRSSGSPWLLVPPEVRRAFDRMVRAGTPLAEGVLGRPLLGVKSGCNEAFVVNIEGQAGTDPQRDGVARIRGGARAADLEVNVLRPLVRGEAVVPWRVDAGAARIIWTHGADGLPLDRLPPGAARWFAPFRRRLTERSDVRGRGRWWALFRTEGAAYDRPRVVWPDVGRAPRCAILEAGDPTVPLNSCYVLRCRDTADAATIAALLNSPLCAAWLNVLGEPARGGYRRYFAWTMALLPLPSDWVRARMLLAPLAERALSGDIPSAADLGNAALDAFRLRRSSVEALLTWSAC